MRVDPLELELASDLVDLVDAGRGGDLLDRVRALRRKVALELGIVIPLVRTRDNLDLPPRTYAIRVHGVEVGARRGAARARARHRRRPRRRCPARPTREPVFGLAAKWVPVELRHQAELAGATVVDRVLGHHHPPGRGRAQQRRAGCSAARTCKTAHRHGQAHRTRSSSRSSPRRCSRLGEIQRVLQALLDEGVSIRDLVRIFEALSLRAPRHHATPTAWSRPPARALGPADLGRRTPPTAQLPVLTSTRCSSRRCWRRCAAGERGSFLALDPMYAERLAVEAARLAEQAEQRGDRPVLVCAPPLRPPLRRLVEAAAPRCRSCPTPSSAVSSTSTLLEW